MAAFLVLGLFMAFVVYLIIPPQTIQPEKHVIDATTPRSQSFSPTELRPPSRVAIVDQLGAHFPNPSFIETAEEMMRRAGFQVDLYGPDRVTVNMYASIPSHGYRLIVFRVHAGVNEEMEGSPVGLFTTEPYSEFKYPGEQLTDLVGSAQALYSPEVVFAVTPKFIREKSAVDYGGAIIVLTGCFGLYSQELPQAFVDRGASVVIGWDRLVDAEHTDEAMLLLLRMMLIEGMDVEDAVRATMEEVGPDLENESVLNYHPKEEGGLKLSEPSAKGSLGATVNIRRKEEPQCTS